MPRASLRERRSLPERTASRACLRATMISSTTRTSTRYTILFPIRCIVNGPFARCARANTSCAKNLYPPTPPRPSRWPPPPIRADAFWSKRFTITTIRSPIACAKSCATEPWESSAVSRRNSQFLSSLQPTSATISASRAARRSISGCYPLHMIRHFSGTTPIVKAARARIGAPEINVAMEADLELPGGATARMNCSMEPTAPLQVIFEAHGERGSLSVVNPLAPHRGHQLTIKTPAGEKQETFRSTRLLPTSCAPSPPPCAAVPRCPPTDATGLSACE